MSYLYQYLTSNKAVLAAVALSALVTAKLAHTLVYRSRGRDTQQPSQLVEFRPYCIQCGVPKFPRKTNCGHSFIEPLLEVINQAQHSIDVCMCVFTEGKFSSTLIAATKRGVTVRVIVDMNMGAVRGSEVPNLIDAGIPIKTNDACCTLMHNKFCIIDGKAVLTGSLNWTKQAIYGNYESVLILRNPAGVCGYIRIFERLWDSFVPFVKEDMSH